MQSWCLFPIHIVKYFVYKVIGNIGFMCWFFLISFYTFLLISCHLICCMYFHLKLFGQSVKFSYYRCFRTSGMACCKHVNGSGIMPLAADRWRIDIYESSFLIGDLASVSDSQVNGSPQSSPASVPSPKQEPSKPSLLAQFLQNRKEQVLLSCNIIDVSRAVIWPW